jgi:glycosyltransferase involved in cell wall biosynthesis
VRILIVTPWFPSIDALESGIFVAREARALAVSHDVTILHVDANSATGHPIEVDGAEVSRIRLDRRSPQSIAYVRRTVQRLGADADIVHTHALPGLIPWLLGRPGRPWVHTEHWSGLPAPETLTAVERFTRMLLRPVLNRPDLVIAECQRLASAVRATRRGRVEIVPCIVPFDRPVVDPPEGDVFRISGVGGLIPRKGPHLAVDAILELRRRGIKAQLTWVGGGALRGELEDRVARENLQDEVRFLGPLPSSQVSEVLEQSHLFLLPTQGDNFCVVAAEALVHGRPLVSGANTGAVDYTPAEVGAFVTPQTGEAYANAIVAVRDRSAWISAESISRGVRDRFRPETVAATLTALYEGLIRR